MNKYYKNIIMISFIVILALLLFEYWLNLSFGYAQTFLIIGGGYGIYLNFKELMKERKQL